jgi:hypothetical protein
VFISDALALFRIAIVRFILPLAGFEGIALGTLGGFRLVMEGLGEPIGVPAGRLSSRRREDEKRGEHYQNPRTIPHFEPPIRTSRLHRVGKYRD